MNKHTILDTILEKQQIALFYLGQEGFLIKTQNKHILIDPYLSNYVDENCCTESVKWIRRYPAPIAADELDFIDYVLLTHEHYDHADPITISIISRLNPNAVFIAPEPIKDTIISYGVSPDRVIGAISQKSITFDDLLITPLPAAHEELDMDEKGNYYNLGYKLLINDISIFHAGDCCIYDGLSQSLQNINVLMVPINGRSYYKRYVNDIIGNMTAEEAIILAKEIHADMIIPMHYDLYDVNCINPAHFVDCLFTINPMQKFHMFSPGECYIAHK